MPIRKSIPALACSILALALSLGVTPLRAEPADDKAALAGIKEVKVAFDVTEGDAKGLLNRISVIDETRASLLKQGVTPSFVIAFRGPATKLVQKDMEKVKAEDREVAGKIAAKIAEMSKAPGVASIEQCSVAIRQQETKAENVLPEIKVIGNSWISLMAYQSRGYAYIRP
jgi:intracellular sulfur oxidation DsrE/DsrF family protein